MNSSNVFGRVGTLWLTGTLIISISTAEAKSDGMPSLPLPQVLAAGKAVLTPVAESDAKGLALSYPSLLLYQKDGDADTALFGYSVDGGGDVNGDGVPDFIVGAVMGLNLEPGTAHVYSGLDGGTLFQLSGSDSADYFGFTVAILGDINSDGRAEFMVGAPQADPGAQNDAGAVFVYSGLDGSLLQQKDGAAAGDNFGQSLARAGDVNGDNRPDYLIGAPGADSGSKGDAGIAYVYSGMGGGLLYRKFGKNAGDRFGYSVNGAGLINGDARADFIVGAPYYADSNTGSVYVFSGLNGDTLFHIVGDSSYDEIGWSVAGTGDVNGDGRSDFITGSPSHNSYQGSAYVYSGLNGSLLRRFDGREAGYYLGYSVAGAGDVNGDGRADVIIGAPAADPTGFMFAAGAAEIYSVMSGTLLHQSFGANAIDEYGVDVASVGDLNGDGRSEFIVGAPTTSPNGVTFGGSAYVLAWGAFEEITDLSDVGNDQGKHIRIQWSHLPDDDPFVQEFAIYRRIDGNTSVKGFDPYNLKSYPPGTWDFVQTVPSSGESSYNAVVPTLRDSTIADGMSWTVFFVRGIGENPVDHFDSPVDSGYSLDNLAPAPPASLFAAQSGADIELDWKSTTAADFDYYWVYRDTLSGFSLTPDKRIGATSDTSFLDNSVPAPSKAYYRVSAVDFSGNEGLPSIEASTSACACDCAHDPQCDGVSNVFDVTHAINIAFRGAASIPDPNVSCPWMTTDVDCNGVTNIFDVTRLINVAFRGGNTAVEYCNPCD